MFVLHFVVDLAKPPPKAAALMENTTMNNLYHHSKVPFHDENDKDSQNDEKEIQLESCVQKPERSQPSNCEPDSLASLKLNRRAWLDFRVSFSQFNKFMFRDMSELLWLEKESITGNPSKISTCQ